MAPPPTYLLQLKILEGHLKSHSVSFSTINQSIASQVVPSAHFLPPIYFPTSIGCASTASYLGSEFTKTFYCVLACQLLPLQVILHTTEGDFYKQSLISSLLLEPFTTSHCTWVLRPKPKPRKTSRTGTEHPASAQIHPSPPWALHTTDWSHPHSSNELSALPPAPQGADMLLPLQAALLGLNPL